VLFIGALIGAGTCAASLIFATVEVARRLQVEPVPTTIRRD